MMSLPQDSLTTWDEVVNKFMNKYYSHQKTTALRQKIATFQQQDGEPIHEAWDHFKQLQIDCPHHHFPTELLNQFFYDGLTMQGQCMVDSAAGGTIGVKTAAETGELYEMLGANSQQKSVRHNGRRATANEASFNSEIMQQIHEMNKNMQKLLAHNNAYVFEGNEPYEVEEANWRIKCRQS